MISFTWPIGFAYVSSPVTTAMGMQETCSWHLCSFGAQNFISPHIGFISSSHSSCEVGNISTLNLHARKQKLKVVKRLNEIAKRDRSKGYWNTVISPSSLSELERNGIGRTAATFLTVLCTSQLASWAGPEYGCSRLFAPSRIKQRVSVKHQLRVWGLQSVFFRELFLEKNVYF